MMSQLEQTVIPSAPTVWGLSPLQLHDRFWAARGVQVVRHGEPSEIVDGAELFLLTESRTLAIFKLTRPVEALSWLKPDILAIRLHDVRERGYRERVVTGPGDCFVRFERLYGGSDPRLARVALTPDRRLAQLWQKAPNVSAAWRLLREEVARPRRAVVSVVGNVYDRDDASEVMQFLRDLVQGWRSPDSTVNRLAQPSAPGLGFRRRRGGRRGPPSSAPSGSGPAAGSTAIPASSGRRSFGTSPPRDRPSARCAGMRSNPPSASCGPFGPVSARVSPWPSSDSSTWCSRCSRSS